MSRLYDFSKFGGIEVVVTPVVGDNMIVLQGRTTPLDPVGFKRKLSVWNLLEGTISGNCEPEEVVSIHLSEKNKIVLDSYIARGKKIKA